MKINLFENSIWKVRNVNLNINNEINSLVENIENSKDRSVISHISDNALDTIIHGSNDGMYNLKLFSKYENIIVDFQSFIDDQIEMYCNSVNWKYQSYDIIHSWINLTTFGTSQEWHFHANSTISAVYYHNTNPKHGGIIFKNPNPYMHMNMFPAQSAGIHFFPEPNTLFLFPSWMEHKTDKNKDTNKRISIAFNIVTY